MIQLPPPRADGGISLERAIRLRRSIREFGDGRVSLPDLSSLLFSIAGVTDPGRGFRATPSAGALYPVDLWVLASRVDGIDAGSWRYEVGTHALSRTASGDPARAFADAAFGQGCVAAAAVSLLLCADYERLRPTYFDLSPRLAWLEMGHAAQNASLQAAALGLGAVCIGAMDAGRVRAIAGVPGSMEPVYAVSVGHPLAAA